MTAGGRAQAVVGMAEGKLKRAEFCGLTFELRRPARHAKLAARWKMRKPASRPALRAVWGRLERGVRHRVKRWRALSATGWPD